MRRRIPAQGRYHPVPQHGGKVVTQMHKEMERIQAAAAAVRRRADFVPEAAVVLGSGLGGFADMVRQEAVIPYGEIPGFPVSTAPGHAGRLVLGWVESTPVAVMQGRVHLYEGYDPAEVVRPIRLMGALGAQSLILTNASGGIGEGLEAGSLMLLTDHISCFVPSPLRGENLDSLGPRFPDMSQVYDRDLRARAQAAAERTGVPLLEGVYLQFPGPNFETPAEIRAFARLGADAVGMSTVVEAIAARHMGLRVCGISCVANRAAGLSGSPLSGEEVIEVANRTAPRFRQLLWNLTAGLGRKNAGEVTV